MRHRLTRRSFLSAAAAFLPALHLSANALQPAPGSNAGAARFSAIESRLGGRLGVCAWDARTATRIEYRAGERFPMCSTFKFLLVSAILSRVDAQKERLSRTIRYTKSDLLDYAPITQAHLHQGGMTVSALCAAAIEYSDNTAANLLLNSLGGPAAVTRYARSLGDSLTRLDRNEPSLNSALPGDIRDTTTPSAMLADMETVLLKPRALSPDSSHQLEAWMIADTTGATSLRAGLPSAWRVGDKTGSGGNGATNDIAICWPPRGSPILIAAYFVGSHASYGDRCAALAEVARIVVGSLS